MKTWIKKHNTPDIEYLTKKTLKYIDNINWYKNSLDIIKKFYPTDYILFIDILAITSPRTTVKNNLHNTIKTIDLIKNKRKNTLIYGIANKNIRNNLESYLTTGKYSGVKINNFANSLKLINGSICIDTWMLKAFNIKRRAPNKNDLKHINTIIKAIAYKLNLKTYEIQACLWSYAKKELNNTVHKEFKDFSYYLRSYFNQKTLDRFMDG